MQEDKGGAGISSRVPQPLSAVDPPIASPSQAQLPAPAPSKEPAKEALAVVKRHVFTVELKRGETTIVSWKKLLRESGSGNGEASALITHNLWPDARPIGGVHPGEDDLQHTLQAPVGFSAVIEKIERLYVGRASSDEEEHNIPDDDQYDTEDSFIDDTELDEYFQVDKLSTKHNGYFVNRGKLEWVELSSSPNLALKKRRRKDSTKGRSKTEQELVPAEYVNMRNMKIKAAARNASLVAKKLSPVQVMTSFDEHYQEGKHLKTKKNASSGIYKKRTFDFVINSDIPPSARLLNNGHSSATIEPKDFDKKKVYSSKDYHKSSGTTESFGATNQASREKEVSSQAEPQSKKLFSGNNEVEVLTKMQPKDKHGHGVYSHSSMAPNLTQSVAKEGTMRPKGTTIDRAIRDLEKIVELSRPPDPGVQEVDPSHQGVKRRLPQDVKQKLAKVARLSVSQSKISEEELINRLMGFLGHMVNRKTLKRNIREMVELGLSAKQQKADKLLQIKKEVLQMIKARVSLLVSKMSDHQDGLTDNFQNGASADESRALRAKYCMDVTLEDKICDLYDLHVEGMDEDKGPQSRKLYVELAELWPAGYMDNFGIKDAIYKAKKRRRHKVRDEERIEMNAMKSEEPSPNTQPQAGQVSLPVDPQGQVSASRDKKQNLNVSPMLVGKMSGPTAYPSDSARTNGYTSKHHEITRGNSTGTVSDNGSNAISVDVKKRLKKKPGADLEFRAHPQQMQALPAEKKTSNMPNDDSTLIL